MAPMRITEMEMGEENLVRANDIGRSALMGMQGMVASHLSFNAALGRGSKDVSKRSRARSPGQRLAAGAWPEVSQQRHVDKAFRTVLPWLEEHFAVD